MLDPSDDFLGVIDGLTPVAVLRTGTAARTEVAHALRQAGRARQSGRSPEPLAEADAVWHLPAAELPEAPRPGDVILDAGGTRWTILDVRHATLGSRWQCSARDLALHHGLDAYVDIEKVEYVKGSGGADEPSWHVWKTGLRARIEPQSAAVGQKQDRQVTTARFTVFLADDLSVDHTHRIKAADGTLYTVTGYRKADRIDALMEIEVVREERSES
jgi:hypothetical protein